MSNEFGYMPESPEQSFGNNKGIFTPTDIYDLTRADKWTDLGQLELIETQTATSLTTPNYIDFSSIQSDVYNVHFLTWSMEGTNSNPMYIQFFESGTIESGSNYQYANQYGGTGGSFSDSERSTSSTYIHLVRS